MKRILVGACLCAIAAMCVYLVPNLVYGDIGEPCSEAEYCRDGVCIGHRHLSREKDGYCSKECTHDEDCPSGYRCRGTREEDTPWRPSKTLTCISTSADAPTGF